MSTPLSEAELAEREAALAAVVLPIRLSECAALVITFNPDWRGHPGEMQVATSKIAEGARQAGFTGTIIVTTDPVFSVGTMLESEMEREGWVRKADLEAVTRERDALVDLIKAAVKDADSIDHDISYQGHICALIHVVAWRPLEAIGRREGIHAPR